MARKAQSKWEQVSDLVGRIELSVSGKAHTDKQGKFFPDIPATSGFYVEIRYESRADEKYHALCSSRVAVQNTLKDYYWAHGRFPVEPGKLFKATSSGGMDLPNTVLVDRVEKMGQAGELDASAIERLKAMIALAEVKMAEQPTATPPADDDADASDQGKKSVQLKYDIEELRKLGTQKLRQLAQDDDIDGYATKPRNELVDALAAIEK